MKTFLKSVVEDLYETLSGNFDDVTVIFPNKRASLYFNRYLGDMISHPIWLPKYATIDELFASCSPYTVVDDIQAICLLHKSYDKYIDNCEPLDKFFAWGKIMLNDFDDIDRNLVNAEGLFKNLRDMQDLTTFDYLSDMQKNAIQQFFNNFQFDNPTQIQERFMLLWNNLYNIYQDFKNTLVCKNYAYKGMLNREVIETLKGDDNYGISERFSSKNYAFVGFNVLNKCEKELFKFIKENHNAYFYWDYDKAYSPANANNREGEGDVFEAYQHIKRNSLIFPNKLDIDDGIFDNFSKEKKIDMISFPTDTAMAAYISQWEKDLPKEDTKAADTDEIPDTAIVLCDESLLQPVLHSMPLEDKGNESRTINVTMGYPLKLTNIGSFMEALINLQLYGKANQNVWYSQQVINVLNHPYCHLISKDNVNIIIKEMTENNIAYPTSNRLHRDDFLKAIFDYQSDCYGMIDYLNNIVQQLGIFFKEKNLTYKAKGNNDGFRQPLNDESIYQTHILLNKLRNISELKDIHVQTCCQLIRQLIDSCSIPFHGEPLQGLQVMGMLETRNLDFKNLLVLSVSDDHLPRRNNAVSLIPYNFREAFGMTTQKDNVTIYAYYFFRLLQRAENISLAYNDATNDMSKGEMSRFLLQMIVDKDIFSPKQQIRKLKYNGKNTNKIESKIEIKKTPDIIEKMRETYDVANKKPEKENKEGENDKHVFLSPSAINKYLDCSLAFYFRYVANMKPQDEISEDIDASMFGTIFHECMQKIYNPYKCSDNEDKTLNAADIDRILKDKDKISAQVDQSIRKNFLKDQEKSVKYSGELLINKEVITRYIERQLKFDKTLCPIKILNLEQEVGQNLEVTLSDGNKFNIAIGGVIDREDIITDEKQGKLHRIVDYKTSNKTSKYNDVESLFGEETGKNINAHHIRQAFYYSDIVVMNDKKGCVEELYPSLVYVKKLKDQKSALTTNEKQPLNFLDVRDEFHEKMMNTINEMFDSDKPFKQTDNLDNCIYCDFKMICNRGTGVKKA